MALEFSMAEKNDRVRDSISNHSTSEDIARMFDNPRVLVGSIYSDSESEPQSEVPAEPEPGDDQENDCWFVEERIVIRIQTLVQKLNGLK